jgi:hypothetical protein
LLKIILSPFIFIYSLFSYSSFKEANEHYKKIALAKDQLGNVFGMYLFNDLLIKQGGYKFGNVDETISSVIGKNKLMNNLTWFGRVVDFILDMIETNHSIKAIEKDETN